jgi:hypothetical protein
MIWLRASKNISLFSIHSRSCGIQFLAPFLHSEPFCNLFPIVGPLRRAEMVRPVFRLRAAVNFFRRPASLWVRLFGWGQSAKLRSSHAGPPVLLSSSPLSLPYGCPTGPLGRCRLLQTGPPLSSTCAQYGYHLVMDFHQDCHIFAVGCLFGLPARFSKCPSSSH